MLTDISKKKLTVIIVAISILSISLGRSDFVWLFFWGLSNFVVALVLLPMTIVEIFSLSYLTLIIFLIFLIVLISVIYFQPFDRRKILVSLIIYLFFLGGAVYLFTSQPPETPTHSKGAHPVLVPGLPWVQIGETISWLKDQGVNTIRFVALYWFTNEGNIYPTIFQRLITPINIKCAHAVGFNVYLSSYSYHIGLFRHTKFNRIPKDTRKMVLKSAEIADKTDIELFGFPGDGTVGAVSEDSLWSKWAQKMLPKVKNFYDGKIVFDGAIHRHDINTVGYDYISYEFWIEDYPKFFDDQNIENFSGIASETIKIANTRVERDNLSGAIISDFESMSGMRTLDFELKKDLVAEAYDQMYTRAFAANVSVFPDLGQAVSGTPKEKILKRWYTYDNITLLVKEKTEKRLKEAEEFLANEEIGDSEKKEEILDKAWRYFENGNYFMTLYNSDKVIVDLPKIKKLEYPSKQQKE